MESIEQRKARLREEIEHTRRVTEAELARKERHLESLEAMPDFGELADGTVAALTIRYGRSRPYVVIAYKADDKWFLTGERSPNGVSSGELATWLVTQGRGLYRVDVLAEVEAVQVSTVDLGVLLGMMPR